MKAKSSKLKCPFKIGDLVLLGNESATPSREGIHIVLTTRYYSTNKGRFETYYMWCLSQRTGKMVHEQSCYVVAAGKTDD